MPAPTTWTARDACSLETALRLTQEGFAERLGVAVRTVAKWHEKPGLIPTREIQQALDTALERASPAARLRFEDLQSPAPPLEPEVEPALEAAHERLASDPHIGSAIDWLDRVAERQPGSARAAVAAVLARARPQDLLDRASRRARVGRRAIVDALAAYYGSEGAGLGFYQGLLDARIRLRTPVLTRREWLDLSAGLGGAGDGLRFRRGTPQDSAMPDEDTFQHASRRLAETLVLGGRLVNRPLYRLLDIEVSAGAVAGQVGTTTFAAYALTLDLLEGELLDELAIRPAATVRLPLRDTLLPTLTSIVDVSGRLCAGGVLALCAIARPQGDYVLLVQERSSAVLNAPRTLAVIPKGFHQPLNDPVANVSVGQTLMREMEEELFGREDVDNTAGRARHADPMHATRLSLPMSWLLNHPSAWRMESTGFGLNAVSGNFEVASLVTIHDETFWSTFGGAIEANWESEGLQLHSSLDHAGLADLATDDEWNNESLFALLQGLRRLVYLDPERVESPTIRWELA